MPLARVTLVLVLSVGVLVGCRKPDSEQRALPPPPLPSTSAAVAAVVGSVLADVRSRLSVAAPAWQLQPLAFGSRLFVRLQQDGAQVYSVPELKLLYEQKLSGPRGVVALPGGSVLVVGDVAAYRVDPGARRAVELAPVPWVPGTVLLPERRDPGTVWGVQRGGRLFVQQKLVKKGDTGASEPISLDGYEGGAVAALRDAAFLFRSTAGVSRSMPRGRPLAYATPFDAWRILPAPRVDQAWLVGADGSVERVQLADRLSVVQKLSLGAAPIDVTSNRDYLAAVVVDEPKGTERRFRLVVHTNEGAPVLDRPLPPGPAATGENWSEATVRDRHVALSESEPLVAVGGSGALEILKLPGGEKVL
jgi:hypothetical protein